MISVSIIYDSFPHYRLGVIKLLNKSSRFSYSFYGSKVSRDKSILTFSFDSEFQFYDTPIFQLGPFTLQKSLIIPLLRSNSSIYIFLGNPYFISTWLAALLLRIKGARVYFWSHGWLSEHENFLKRLFRNTFFKLAHGIFLYGQRAKNIGVKQGFREENLHVINNSLDYAYQKQIFSRINEFNRIDLCEELGISKSGYKIICSARLTPNCRFDILLNAIALLKKTMPEHLQVILIGDGIERTNLSKLANELDIDVIFWGACYDETTLCKLYSASDLTISPGKVGLTAMHSMAYGTPVISHNNFDKQMPEFEAIIPGVTGDFFEENSAKDLARTIQNWFNTHPQKPVDDCINVIERSYTPEFQRGVIESVLMKDLSK